MLSRVDGVVAWQVIFEKAVTLRRARPSLRKRWEDQASSLNDYDR